ncbi:E3 ubiquitin-protein ligase [Tetrabaena socialis]|uniref:RING-type E3 ubiquitin transferase n=1 Tax=Tetrabaena socialis TaxID=47790 RepID=A0A2J7ZSA4_9CHLO|nr:E3 ubiquitin-protein ligase [Tetrabaena socialis]|eukprot:PNH03152.1 E3 ubiquitin-protein ligase [Tetrabaena socialis]
MTEREIGALLEKRATFHRGLGELRAAVASTSPNNTTKLEALLALLPRVVTLLRTRYSNVTQWKAAAEVFRACEARASTAQQTARVAACLAEAEAFLSEHDLELPGAVAAASEAAAAAALANVPLSDVLMGLGQQQAVEVHYDDTGPILDDEDRRRRIEGGGAASTTAPAAAAAAAAGSGEEGGEAGTGAGGEGGAAAGGGRTRLQQRADMQAAILEGIQAVYSGMSAVARGTEAIERELDAVLAALHSRTQPHQPSRPPASRKAVAALPRIVLDAETLERQLNREAVCPVCTEHLAVGDEVQLLPCKHSYHVACLAPWLAQSNSCPVCRTELPTDDAGYEAKKERDAEEARERRGADNALSHGEFTYI